MSAKDDAARSSTVAALRRARPRDRWLRASLYLLSGAAALSWALGAYDVGEAFSERRMANLARFLGHDIVPPPLRDRPFSASFVAEWVVGFPWARGLDALVRTFWIAVLAIALATAAGLVTAPLAAATLRVRDPFLGGERGSSWTGRAMRRVVRDGTRAALIGARAVPEYVLAFFLLAMIGPGAWPAVLALALHNAGILGRLGAEVVENLESGPLRALAQLGGRRSILVAIGAFPLALGRFLLYVFYRFETCVREATVLGMLGILSLGYWIREARSRGEHDVMLFHVALGGLLVLFADLASGLIRRRLRRPGERGLARPSTARYARRRRP